MKRVGSLALGLALSLTGMTPVDAQISTPTNRDRIEQQLNSQRAATKAAYHSKDPKRIAAQRAKLRAAYGANWREGHRGETTTPTDRDRVEQQLNSQRAATKAAYHSKDLKRIAAQRAKLRAAYGADWQDDHGAPSRAHRTDNYPGRVH